MRYRLRPSLIAVLLVGLAMLVARPAQTAQASEWWCWDDPVLLVDGQVLHIAVGVPRAALANVTVADLVITVPAGVEARLTGTPEPRFAQTLRVVQGPAISRGAPVVITATVTVRARTQTVVGLRVNQPSRQPAFGFGMTGQPISVTTVLFPRKPDR